jgi:hypothetical protein
MQARQHKCLQELLQIEKQGACTGNQVVKFVHQLHYVVQYGSLGLAAVFACCVMQERHLQIEGQGACAETKID